MGIFIDAGDWGTDWDRDNPHQERRAFGGCSSSRAGSRIDLGRVWAQVYDPDLFQGLQHQDHRLRLPAHEWKHADAHTHEHTHMHVYNRPAGQVA